LESDIGLPLAKPRASAFSALRKRNVQLYMLGMFVSQAGNAMQVLAAGWLVYQLTHSAFKLGLVGFLAAIPLAPWSLVAGTISDRMSRRKLLAMALVGEAIPPLILAYLTWIGQAQVWHVIVVSVLLGAFGFVDFSSRMPLIQSMVHPDEVQSGFAIAVSLMNVARIVGPALGGILIAVVGVTGAFTFNGLSFLFVLGMLALMHVPNRPQHKQRASLAANLVEAPLYILRDRLILIFVVMVLAGSFFVLPTLTLLPVFAQDILAVGPQGLGFLSAAGGVGAVLGGVILAGQPTMNIRRRLVLAIGLMLALAPVTAAFAYSRNFIFSLLMLALVNGGFVAFRVVSFSHIYMKTPDGMRGRISSILQVGLLGTQNVGSLVSGYIASLASAPASVALGGLMCLLFGLTTLGLVFPKLRRGGGLARNAPQEELLVE
jgi:predicted MFS family arabinose efflux permease